MRCFCHHCRSCRVLVTFGVLLLLLPRGAAAQAVVEDRPPNIIYVMIDDAGYADFGAMGSKQLATPTFDRMCREGMRFTDHYSGSAVCAPTRCVLMTGLHTGHCRIRHNKSAAARSEANPKGLIFLEAKDQTVAESLQQAGYVTGMIGKWGLGIPGSEGVPEKQGFDYFFGYLDQVHAHDHFTDHLWHNGRKIDTGGRYSHDLFERETLRFIKDHKDEPFFLYLPYCLPHAQYVIPHDDPAYAAYADKPWSQPVRNYAAMVTRVDRTVGDILDLLDELDLDEQTIVFFTSDNGPNHDFIDDLNSNGPFIGIKRTLYEGGLRAAMAVRWPGRTPENVTSDYVWGMRDVFPTACDLAGIEPPAHLDGISVKPTLLGQTQTPREALYWTFPSDSQQAVRMGTWKGLRFGTETALQLFDIVSDPGETTDVAASHPEVVARIEQIMAEEHTPSKFFPLESVSNRNSKAMRQVQSRHERLKLRHGE